MGTKEDLEEWKAFVANNPDIQAARPQKTSAAMSAVRGVGQGVTSGWGDEIAGGLDTAISKVPVVRDIAQWMEPSDRKLSPLNDPSVPMSKRIAEHRGVNDAARESNPSVYTGGNVLGGVAQNFIPGLGAVGKLGAAGRIGANVAMGGAAGAGFSDATGSALVKDTLKGAAIGGAVGTLGATAGSAERALGQATGKGATTGAVAATSNAKPVAGAGTIERQEERWYQSVGQKADAKAQQQLEQMGPQFSFNVAKKHGLVDAHDPRIPGKAAEQAVGAKIGEAYKVIDGAGVKNGPSMNEAAPTSTVSTAAIGDALGAMESKLSKRYGTQHLADEVATTRKGLIARHPNGISLEDLNAEIGIIQTEGYAGPLLNPKTAAKLKRVTAHALDEVHDNALKTIKTERPDVAAAIDALPALKAEYGALKTINGIYAKRIPKDRFAVPEETTLRQSMTAPIKGTGRIIDEKLADALRAIPGGQTGAKAVAGTARVLSPAIIDHLTQGNKKAAIDQMGAEVYGE